MQRVYEFLKKADTYYLATVEQDQPRVRPFGTVLVYEGKLYIQTGKAKEVTKQIINNPKVEICAFNEGRWVRVSGTLVLDERVEVQEAMLNDYPSLRRMYTTGPEGNCAVFYLKDAKATFSSFTEPPMSVEF